jgi:hypothetical protein
MRSSALKVLVGSALCGFLACAAQAQFTFTHIGGGATGDLTTNDLANGSYTFNGGGNDIWSGGDEFDFAHYSVTGDFDVRVQVTSVEPVARWTKAGLMAREFNISASRMAFTRVTPPDVPTGNGGNGANDVKFSYRTGVTSGPQGEHEDGGAAPGYPNTWVRLARAGNTFYSFFSTDGTNWSNMLGSQDTTTWEGGAMPATLQFGLAVGRHSGGDAIATVEFTNYSGTPIMVGQNPSNTTVSVGQTAVFTVAPATSFGPLAAYQWYQFGTNLIPGATSATYNKPNCQLVDDASTYSCLISNKGNTSVVWTAEATLTVIDSPIIVSANTPGDPSSVYVTFTKAMDPATTEFAGAYAIDNGITVNTATFVGAGSNVVRLAVTPALSPGVLYTVTITDVTDPDGNFTFPDPDSKTFRLNDGYNGPAAITMKRFDGIGGGVNVSDLTGNANFPCNPSSTSTPTEFEIPPNVADNYGAQLFGIFIAPVSGDYKFYISADDGAAVYLSSDASPAGKVVIATEPQWNNPRQFLTGDNQGSRGSPPSNISATKSLVAGNAYYIEALVKEGGGGDNLAVAVEYPGSAAVANGSAPIPSSLFSPRYSIGCPPKQFFQNFGPVAVVTGPSNQTAIELNTATFTVDLDGTAPWTMQWYKNGSLVPGATNLSYSEVANYPGDNGATFQLIANNAFGSATSSVAVLTVIPAPQLVGASSRYDTNNHIYVQFTKDVNNEGTNGANYAVTGGINVVGVDYLYSNTVRLTVDVPLTFGSSYTVTVTGVQDADGNAQNPSPASSTFTHMQNVNAPQGLTYKRYQGIGGGAVSDLVNNGNFPCNPTATDTGIASMEHPGFGDGLNDYGAWIYGVFVAPISGTYRFATSSDDGSSVYLSSDASPASKTLISAQGGWNGWREYAGRESAPISMIAGNRYYLEVLMKEGGGGDHVSVAVQKPGDPAIANGQGPISRDLFATNYSLGCPPTLFFDIGALTLLSQPADQTVAETTILTWTAPVNGSPSYSYTWYSNGTVVGTSPSYTVRAMRYTDGAVYGLTVSNGFSGVAATNWVLTVISDVTPPTLVRAYGSGTFDKATVVFNEPVDTVSGVIAANYAITNSSGGSLTVISAVIRDNTNVVLTTAPQTQDEVYTVIVNNVADRAGVPNPIAPDSTVSFTAWHYSPGFALMETFEAGGGTTIPLLTGHATYPNYPRSRHFINAIDSRLVYPDDSHENYGGRISGLFIAPATANYRLYVANDDDVRINASTNDNANFTTPVYAAPCCQPAAFAPTHPGPTLPLAGGTPYYYEVLWKEGGGGDYARVSADAATAIGSQYLAVYANPDDTILTVSPLANVTNVPNNYVSFTVTANNTAGFPQTQQWQRWDGASYTNIPGATGNTLIFGPTSLADDGSMFRVVVHTPGRTATSGATLYIIADTVGPRLLSARVNTTFTNIYLTFSEAMENASSVDALSYTVTDTNGNPVDLFPQGLQTSPSNIVMFIMPTTPLVEGMVYIVDAAGVLDANSNPIDPIYQSTNFTAFVRNRGFVRHDFYTGIGGGTIADLLNAGSYPNSPNVTYYTNNTDFPQSVPNLDDYGLRMSGYFIPTVSGTHVFSLKYDDDTRFSMSTDDSPANLVQLLAFGCCNDNFNGAASVNLVAGQRYYFEALVKEAGGGDYLTVGVLEPGAPGTVAITSLLLANAIDPTTPSSVPADNGIDTQPVSVTSYSPDNAVFSVGVTNAGSGVNWYQWQIKPAGTNVWSDIPFANSSTYTVTAPCPGQSGDQYRVYYAAVPGRSFLSSAATLTVYDTNAPIVTCPAPITNWAPTIAGIPVSFSASAVDVCDPAPSVACVPASGSIFPAGVNPVLCTAWDASGNTNTCMFDVVILADTNPPAITCPSNISVEATGPSGAVAIYSASATDLESGIAGLDCVPPSGSTFAVGTTVVTCTAWDNVGNTNVCMFSITVTDTTPPVIVCPTNQVAQCTGTNGVQVSFTPTATDIVDGSVAVISTPPSGSYFTVGTNIVTCEAVDAHGNTNICMFQIVVEDPVSPVLAIVRSGTNVVLSWPASCTTYTLKRTDSLSSPITWATETATVDLVGDRFQVTLPAAVAARFYRLTYP